MASASGALGFGLALPARGVRDVYVAVPLHRAAAIPRRSSAAATAVLGEEALATAIHDWEVALSRSVITLPPSARRVSETLRSSVAYMLLERHGAALQPGTRAYARSWIRDGALMSAALERLGQADAARQFIDWFLPFQRPDGRVPCCVDARGADPVPEHDSHGELIYLVAEYWRLTGDSAFAARAWPHVTLAVAYIDSLRRTHMSPLYQTDSGRVYFGLLPPSISHEGYSAKPMHSYWDDFFALKGLSDAADLAAMLGRTDDQRRIAALRDEFRHALLASIGLSMARHPRISAISTPPRRRSRLPPAASSAPYHLPHCSGPSRSTTRTSPHGVMDGSPGTRTRPTSSARSVRSFDSATSAARTSSSTFSSTINDRRRGGSGLRSCGRTRWRQNSSATCRMRGSRPTTCAPSSIASPTSAPPTVRSCSAPAYRKRGCGRSLASMCAGSARTTAPSATRCACAARPSSCVSYLDCECRPVASSFAHRSHAR